MENKDFIQKGRYPGSGILIIDLDLQKPDESQPQKNPLTQPQSLKDISHSICDNYPSLLALMTNNKVIC